MQSTLHRTAVHLWILSTVFILVSCVTDTSAWYPSGSASILSSYERTEDYEKICAVTVKIENTGASTISSYTISLSAATDIRTYYRTFTDSLTILPGKSAYIDIEICYASDTETIQEEGPSLIDQYYQ